MESLSMAKEEYKASAMAAQDCTWLIWLMKDLHQQIDCVI